MSIIKPRTSTAVAKKFGYRMLVDERFDLASYGPQSVARIFPGFVLFSSQLGLMFQ